MSAPVKVRKRQRLQSRYTGMLYRVTEVRGDVLRLVSTDGRQATTTVSEIPGLFRLVG